LLHIMASRPNLLIVLADEWRKAALGRFGEDPVHTPNLDRFAEDSTVITHAVSNFPVCSPHRAMLMSGMFPWANGVTANCNSLTSPHDVGLREDLTCWSDVLASVGYRCGYIGKWHLDRPVDGDETYGEGPRRDGVVWDAYTPPGRRRHGFETWHSYGCCDRHFTPHYWVDDAPRDKPTRVDRWSPEHDTNVAIDFITRDDEQPWALVVSYNPPHMPFHEVPERYRRQYADIPPADLLTRPNVDLGTRAAVDNVASYFAMVTGIDDQIGRLLEVVGDDTLVLITSDHGEMLGSHGLMAKKTWYDESLLVPMLIRLPGTVPPGENDLLVSTPDIYPTLFGLMGFADHVPPGLHGRDLSAAVIDPAGGERPRCAVYLNLPDPHAGSSNHPRVDRRDVRGLRTHRWTYVVQREPEHRRLLYDLTADPYQLTDVLADNEDVAAGLEALLREELVRVDDPWTR